MQPFTIEQLFNRSRSRASLPLCYLFKSPRGERISGKIPNDFLYGFQHVSDNFQCEALSQEELHISSTSNGLASRLNSALYVLTGVNVDFCLKLLFAVRRGQLSFDQIFATTNNFSVSLAILRTLGLIKSHVTCMAMGLITDQTPSLGRLLYKRILRSVQLVAISRPEAKFLSETIGTSVEFAPFGIDTRFWRPGRPTAKRDYVLSVGNDLNRDFELLVSVWQKDYPELRIVTARPTPGYLPENVRWLRGNWFSQTITDADLRKLYQLAKFVIIPNRDTIQPAGQSVCLQAMACGAPVILANVRGLWEPTEIQHSQNALLYRPGDAHSLAESITMMLRSPMLRKKLARNGRSTVLHRYTSKKFGAALSQIFENQRYEATGK